MGNWPFPAKATKFSGNRHRVRNIWNASQGFFDAAHGRYQPDEFAIKLDGIEIWEPYISELTRTVYDRVFIGNALDIMPTLAKERWDVVFSIEAIEHMKEEDGENLIKLMLDRANLGIVLSTPSPDAWQPQKSLWGNPHETHLAVWSQEKLEKMGFTIIDQRPSFVAYMEKPQVEVEEKKNRDWSSHL